MVDKNKNGIDDSKELTTPLSDQQALAGVEGNALAQILASTFANNISSTNNARSGTSVSTNVQRLNAASAKALLTAAAQDEDYMGKLTNADVEQFMKEFEKEQNRQIEKVVTTTAQKTISGGTTQDAVDKTTESTQRTEYPSFFNPEQFTRDFIWSKINFKDEKSLGNKALTALAQARGIVETFQIIGVSPQEVKAAAKLIAQGKKTVEDYTIELQKVAIKEYPQFADRFATDPTLTTYDIALPAIKILAKAWDKDASQIKMDNPLISSWLNYAGPDGKGKQPSYYDLLLKAKDDPQHQFSEEANNVARDSATSLSRAIGYGI
jgi:hypothetical protein